MRPSGAGGLKSAYDAVDGSSARHVSDMDVGAAKAPTIRRSYPCKPLRPLVSTSQNQYFRCTAFARTETRQIPFGCSLREPYTILSPSDEALGCRPRNASCAHQLSRACLWVLALALLIRTPITAGAGWIILRTPQGTRKGAIGVSIRTGQQFFNQIEPAHRGCFPHATDSTWSVD